MVAEGAMPQGGKLVVQKLIEDSPEPIRLGGIGNVVGTQVEEGTGMETRVTVLGHLQRGGSPTAFDRILATRYGNGAVHLVTNNKFGEMVCLQTPDIKSVPLSEAVGELRQVPPDGQMISAAEQIGICLGR